MTKMACVVVGRITEKCNRRIQAQARAACVGILTQDGVGRNEIVAGAMHAKTGVELAKTLYK